jgi:hypothetical protein
MVARMNPVAQMLARHYCVAGTEPSHPVRQAIAEIERLSAALAQQQVEPVAYRYLYSDGYWRLNNGQRVNGCDPVQSQPLYTAPPTEPGDSK